MSLIKSMVMFIRNMSVKFTFTTFSGSVNVPYLEHGQVYEEDGKDEGPCQRASSVYYYSPEIRVVPA
jgi:hypothetical protein